jgi:RNA 2',3'-cyclic 3'-phosphodiesterase
MKPQLSLLDPTSEHTSNVFFALFPDAQVAAELVALAEQLRAQHGLKGKALSAERFHVSLCNVGTYDGDAPEGILAQARRAAASITLPAFDIAFDRARSFANAQSKPFVLFSSDGNNALDALQRTLRQALTRAGLGRGVSTSYTTHLTLLYDAKEVADEQVATVHWTPREFVLVRSLVGKSHYDRLDTWPFRVQEMS